MCLQTCFHIISLNHLKTQHTKLGGLAKEADQRLVAVLGLILPLHVSDKEVALPAMLVIITYPHGRLVKGTPYTIRLIYGALAILELILHAI